MSVSAYGKRVLTFLKREKVLTVSLLLAAVSVAAVPPDRAYLGYVDVRVLALLFCLMLLVKGAQSLGIFDLLIGRLFGGVHSSRKLGRLLVLLCFFTSMVITNDVALITFVPFAILALDLCKQRDLTIRVVVLQTMAANLGSMATPIGNPQNLYLFSASGMGVGQFFGAVLPVAGVSLVLLLAACQLLPDRDIHMELAAGGHTPPRRDTLVFCLLFAVDLLVVFRVLHWAPALVVTVAGVVALGRWRLLGKVDYTLLLTFVGFFVFVGNLGRVDLVSSLITALLHGREVLLSALLSQALSNVPAAILLSGFTQDYTGLLIGTNVGGLGTLIASMASLISYKLYAASQGAEPGKYLRTFTAYNVAGLVVLLAFCLLVL